MENFEYLLTHPNFSQEISQCFNHPKQIMGLLLTSKKIYKNWRRVYQKLLSLYKLQQVIFIKPYFPNTVNVFDKSRKLFENTNVIFKNQKIGWIEVEEYRWSTEYFVRVCFPTNPNIDLSYSYERVKFRGCKLKISSINHTQKQVRSYVKTNIFDAINMCKAIYCYFMEANSITH